MKVLISVTFPIILVLTILYRSNFKVDIILILVSNLIQSQNFHDSVVSISISVTEIFKFIF